MADHSTAPPLTPTSIKTAHAKIKSHIHRTPLLTSTILNQIASSPNPSAYLSSDPPTTTAKGTSAPDPPPPKFNLYFKAENFQKIGAFKPRGAYHAVLRLIDSLGLAAVRARGVVTHSSGNHAQALALAASTFDIPSYIVMPGISTPSKIAGTKLYTAHVIFSGSTAPEREAKVAEVQRETGAVLVPPYDHPDIILGQGTTGLEMAEQLGEERGDGGGGGGGGEGEGGGFDAVIAPIGGGGLLGGVATWFSEPATEQGKKTLVFGAEPSFQGADDAARGLAQGKRVEHVSTLTIADGLRTPVGVLNWEVVSDKKKVEGCYAVSEDEIKMAMRLVLERMKVVVEPSGCVALAVVLFNQEFRDMVVRRQGGKAWDVGIVFSGGNTTMSAMAKLFGEEGEGKGEREEGKVGVEGERKAEDVAG